MKRLLAAAAASVFTSTAVAQIDTIDFNEPGLIPASITACPVVPDAINWYVSPNGDDSNTGTCEGPLRHIQAAIDASADADRTVFIHVAPGRYPREFVLVERRTWNDKLIIQCHPGETCHMDGEWATSYFYRFKGSPGQCQNVTLDGFTIDRYVNWGVMLSDPQFRHGRDQRDDNWNGCNVIRNVTIRRLGNDWGCDEDFTGPCKGYGGVTGQNTDRNLVYNLRCENLRNGGSGAGIHCIYWSNGSSENVVMYSTCDGVTSACYKLRDESNFNVFIGNTCEDGPLCFFSGMPDSREEETQDRSILLRDMTYSEMDESMECKLSPGGDRSELNCEEVIVE